MSNSLDSGLLSFSLYRCTDPPLPPYPTFTPASMYLILLQERPCQTVSILDFSPFPSIAALTHPYPPTLPLPLLPCILSYCRSIHVKLSRFGSSLSPSPAARTHPYPLPYLYPCSHASSSSPLCSASLSFFASLFQEHRCRTLTIQVRVPNPAVWNRQRATPHARAQHRRGTPDKASQAPQGPAPPTTTHPPG